MNNFKPLKDRVSAELISEDEQSGEFWKPDSGAKPNKAKVTAVGDEVTRVKVGDTILIAKFATSAEEITLDGVGKVLVVKEADILGVIG